MRQRLGTLGRLKDTGKRGKMKRKKVIQMQQEAERVGDGRVVKNGREDSC